jgi:hypothetical protein
VNYKTPIRYLLVMLVFLTGITDGAFAVPPAGFPDCQTSPTSKGLTFGGIYCMKVALSKATLGDPSGTPAGYIKNLRNNLAYFRYLAIALAVTLFGMNVATLQVHELTKEAMTLIFKIAIVMYLITNTELIYTALTGTIDQIIGYVTNVFTFDHLPSASCTVVFPASAFAASNPPSALQPYAIWNAFDCMLESLLGAAKADPTKVLVSAVAVIAAAAFTSILGLGIAVFAITTFIYLILTAARAIYLVFLSYITLSFLLSLTPLIAPLLLFRGDTPQGIFQKWTQKILSSIFQPIIVIAFISLTVMSVDMFVEGGTRTDFLPLVAGCETPPAVALGSPIAYKPGCIYSFRQLFSEALIRSNQIFEPNATLFSQAVIGDPQAHSQDGHWWDPALSWGKTILIKGIDWVAQTSGGILSLPGFTRLSSAFSSTLEQLLLTLAVCLIITLTMRSLFETTIPNMAMAITQGMGIALATSSQIPFESFINSRVEKLNSKKKK